jgi:hypothetical protein
MHFFNAHAPLRHQPQRLGLCRLQAIHVEVRGFRVSFPHMGSPFLFARSTGLKIWPGAEALANLMADEDSLMAEIERATSKEMTWQGWQGIHVIELGCGLALLSIVAHRLGAEVSLATDGDVDLITIAKKNLQHNIEEYQGFLMANVLCWGDDQAAHQCLQLCKGRVDVVLISDAVYGSNPGVWENLVESLGMLRPRFILQAETRRIEGLLYDEYWKALQRQGFSFKTIGVGDSDQGLRMWIIWKPPRSP